jgi:primosomal protein N' (replication factor Y)
MIDSPLRDSSLRSKKTIAVAKYANVALPLAVDKVFTYLIPPELHQSAAVGVRTIVPFGRKYVTGLIVGFPESSSLTSLKPLRDILDASPVVSRELLNLCNWIAGYYFAPWGEVLKAAIPFGFVSSSKRVVRNVLPNPKSIAAEIEKRSPQRARVLSLLAEQGSMQSSELQKKTGVKNINVLLNEMVKAGQVEIEEIAPQQKTARRKKEFIVLSDIDDKRLAVTLESLPNRQKKARALLLHIQQLTNQGMREIAVTQLLKESRTTLTILKSFRGLLNIVARDINRNQDYGTEEKTLTIRLNTAQQLALDAVCKAISTEVHRSFLLHGVTGSGKTQVYIEAIRYCLRHSKSAIVLVPEISLTPQIVRRFKSHFAGQVAVVHSRLSAGERHEVWRRALNSEYKIVIGPRSAVFAPLNNLGLIVVDEEHEASYKQFDSSPRYNARDVALVRGSQANAVVLLGSATPSVETFHNATIGKYELLGMPRRIDDVSMPEITIVDMTAERKQEYASLKESLPDEKRKGLRQFQQSSVSSLLKQKMGERLRRKEGIILLQNRRGFAPFVECMDCGYSETCENCNVTLTYHLAKKHLRCHYCGAVKAPHDQCPSCRGQNMQLRGIGTQRVEQELASLFPEANVLRMDLDTTSRKGAHDRLLRKFGDGEADILLGTQMVAKGLDFARVTLVGVISADSQMLLPDFRSSERTFQLLTQVAGRAGRSTLRGEVIIQTHQPNHYTLQHVVDHDFKTFYEQELEARRELDYPPFSRLALVEMKGEKEEHVRQQAERFAQLLKGSHGSFTVLGPSPAVISKIKNRYRWHLILKSKKESDPNGTGLRQTLHRAVDSWTKGRQRSVQLIIDVDPVGLM